MQILYYQDLSEVLDFIVREKPNVFSKSLDTTSYMICLNLLKSKHTRELVITYFKNRIEKIDKFTISFLMNEKIMKDRDNIDKFNTYLFILIYKLWNNGINSNKLSEISSSKSNFLSKTYFLIHEITRKALVRLIEEKRTLILDLTKINNILKDDISLIEQIYFLEKKLIDLRLRTVYDILENKVVKGILSKFSYQSVTWINNQKNEDCLDDILGSLDIIF